MKQYEGHIQRLQRDNSSLFRLLTERDLKDKYPELESSDISQIIGRAVNDPKRKGIWKHAEDFINTKKNFVDGLEKKFAEKYGIDLKEWEERNKMKEEEAKGASAFLKGRKPSFSGGEGTVSPTEAAREYLNNMT